MTSSEAADNIQLITYITISNYTDVRDKFWLKIQLTAPSKM